MLMFVTYMYTKSYRSQTIRSYLSSVRSIHMEEGYSNPSEQSYCIKQALKAIQRSEDKPMKKLPITYEILRKWQSLMSDMLNNVLWKAAFSLAHFALLRASEFTVPAQSQFSPDKNLVNEDVQFHSTEQGYKYIAVHLKQSKTDKNNSGYYIYIGCTGTDVCAYCSMYEFIQSKSHNNDKAPLFQFTNGVILSKTCLVQTIKLFAVRSGIDPSKYSGHSFRIGGATTMASVGMADWEIKLAGRWTSDAYQRYIRAPVPLLIHFARRMAQDSNRDQNCNYRNPYVTNMFK